MNYLVVGAGNASRPVARLLNYLGHKVIITDLKDLSSFKIEFQRSLIQMESEGVILDLNNQNPNQSVQDASKSSNHKKVQNAVIDNGENENNIQNVNEYDEDYDR